MATTRGALQAAGVLGLGMFLGALLTSAAGERRATMRVRKAADLQQRLREALRESRARSGSGAVPDEQLVEHVRAQLARPYLSHPGLVDAQVHRGRVILSGVVRAAEVDDLVTRLCNVPGIRSIESRLAVRDGAHLPADRAMLPPEFRPY